MPIDKSLPNPAEALFDDNVMWLSPVSNIVQRLSNTSFQTPKPKEASVPSDNEVFAENRPLASDTVKFNFDDSCDSMNSFMQNNESGTNSCDNSLSESEILNAQAQNSETPCRPRALTFGASPSAPTLGDGGGSSGSWPRRLLSVPIGASSPSAAKRRQRSAKTLRSAAKRRSPDAHEQLEQLEQQAKSLTPKRQRLERPLADISNGGQQQQQQQRARRALPLERCMSELSALNGSKLDSAKIDTAIANIDSLNLIGNSQQRHSLPTVKEHGRHYGIPYVTPATVAQLLDGKFQESTPSYTVIDCRYPYEFAGGHIRDAVNIFTREQLLESVLQPEPANGRKRPALIFHCEFSSQRAPKLAGFLRDQDRLLNSNNYPNLHFPEVYVLQGGYKAFFESHEADCEPRHYTKMVDPKHREQLAQYERQGKAWEKQNSRSRQTELQRLARRL